MSKQLEFYYQLEIKLNDIIANGTDIPYCKSVRTVGESGFEIQASLDNVSSDVEYIFILLNMHDDSEIVPFKVLIQSYDSIWEDVTYDNLDEIKKTIEFIRSRGAYAHTVSDDVVFPSLECMANLFEEVLATIEGKTNA